MTKNEVISRFCALATSVARALGHEQHAADCFCEFCHTDGSFNFSEKVMEHIEEAVWAYDPRTEESHKSINMDNIFEGV